MIVIHCVGSGLQALIDALAAAEGGGVSGGGSGAGVALVSVGPGAAAAAGGQVAAGPPWQQLRNSGPGLPAMKRCMLSRAPSVAARQPHSADLHSRRGGDGEATLALPVAGRGAAAHEQGQRLLSKLPLLPSTDTAGGRGRSGGVSGGGGLLARALVRIQAWLTGIGAIQGLGEGEQQRQGVVGGGGGSSVGATCTWISPVEDSGDEWGARLPDDEVGCDADLGDREAAAAEADEVDGQELHVVCPGGDGEAEQAAGYGDMAGGASAAGGGEPSADDGAGLGGAISRSYSYVLSRRIARVPAASSAFHLHAPDPGAVALPPWRLRDFMG